MAELTQDTIIPQANPYPDLVAVTIKNATQLYVGQFVDVVSGVLAAHTNGHTPFGMIVGPGVPGNNTVLDAIVLPNSIAPGLTAGTPPPQAVVDIGEMILLNITTIAGLTGALTDVGTAVYLNNTGNAVTDLTTTQPGSDKAVGVVLHWNGSTSSPAWDVRVPPYTVRSVGGL